MRKNKKSQVKSKVKSKIKSKVRPKEKKKKQKKQEDSCSSSSSSEDSTRSTVKSVRSVASVPVNVVPIVLPNSKERQEMPGAMFLRHPEGYLQNLIADERPDLIFTEKLSNSEADCLDKHLKSHAELSVGDEFMIEESTGCYVQYEIRSKYNEGRYSALYIVIRNAWKNGKQIENSGIYMMKTQLRKSSARCSLLIRREVAVLRSIQNKKKRFFPQLIDHGKVGDFPFIILGLVDKNIEKFRAEKGPLSAPTALFVAKEALAALDEIHANKYIHRDVKPANLAFGMGKEAVKVFLLDYGDTVKSGKVIKIGVPDGFTLPYLSLDGHRRVKASNKTDIESWFYVLVDLVQHSGLPWKVILNTEEVVKKKDQFWKEYQSQLNEPYLVQLAEMIITAELNSKTYTRMTSILTDTMNTLLNGSKFVADWMKKN